MPINGQLGRKVMTNLDRILESRDITLPTKVYLVKVMVFPVVMYGCESWTIKKAEHQRIDAFVFSKNQLLALLIFTMVFVSFAFISALFFVIFFLLLTLGFFISFFSSCFRCRVRLFFYFFLIS